MASDPGFGGDALQLALRVIRILEDLGAPAWMGGSVEVADLLDELLAEAGLPRDA
jgi:hypothetical protein